MKWLNEGKSILIGILIALIGYFAFKKKEIVQVPVPIVKITDTLIIEKHFYYPTPVKETEVPNIPDTLKDKLDTNTWKVRIYTGQVIDSAFTMDYKIRALGHLLSFTPKFTIPVTSNIVKETKWINQRKAYLGIGSFAGGDYAGLDLGLSYYDKKENGYEIQVMLGNRKPVYKIGMQKLLFKL